ncbi:hypothetical protein BU26DRAFT_580099 [Trematosphaeria pertusa]|uniref:Uncharacterized protein n=1 Tax=Trematosphaeria pertusa TaxID=390896 RepID=A0A6A6I1G2_9PLEO|nr:uncharacterized protein BU26DRAFT_580099 [Trematosphaeria pertusa]KAF2244161.1 hypothetical protein BU26DRAFT_580099 [Trematosphaeria pertusa]
MSRQTESISAAAIFPPDELKMYLQWQEEQGFEATEGGNISFAIQYHDFITWYNTQLAGPTEHPPVTETVPENFDYETASLCKHALHPANDDWDNEWCPVCGVSICLEFLKAIAQAWDRLDERYYSLMTTNEEMKQDWDWKMDVRSGWHMARVELIEVVEHYEEMAVREAEWNATHEDASLDKIYSASKAIELAKEDSQYRARMMSREEFDKLYICKESRELNDKKPKKKVSFAPDTELDRVSRNLVYCWRTSGEYKPGRYACPSPEGWENTSFYHNGWLIKLSQYKVHIVLADRDLKSAISSLKEGFPQLEANQKTEGPAGLHPLWEKIQAVFLRTLGSPTRRSLGRRSIRWPSGWKMLTP